MQGQEAGPEAVYPIHAFLGAWVPAEPVADGDAEVPPATDVEGDELSLQVEAEDDMFDLGRYPRTLRAPRGAELATLAATTDSNQRRSRTLGGSGAGGSVAGPRGL